VLDFPLVNTFSSLTLKTIVKQMTSFTKLPTYPFEFICFDKQRKTFISDEQELDLIPVSQLLLKKRRYIPLQKVGKDKKKNSLYLYDIVSNEDGQRFFVDFHEGSLQLRSLDTPDQLMAYYPTAVEKLILKEGSMLLLGQANTLSFINQS